MFFVFYLINVEFKYFKRYCVLDLKLGLGYIDVFILMLLYLVVIRIGDVDNLFSDKVNNFFFVVFGFKWFGVIV